MLLFSCLLLGEGLVFHHEVVWADPLQKLKLSWLGEHGLRRGEVLFVIVFSDLVLDAGNAVSPHQHYVA